MGQLIASLFNGIGDIQRKVSQRERETISTNLSLRLICPESNAETYSPGVAYYGWIFRGYEEESAVFSKLSGIQRNGTEYVLKLVIHKDLSQFNVSGHEDSCLNSQEIEVHKGDLQSMALILQYLNTFHLCTSFEEDQHTISYEIIRRQHVHSTNN